MLNRQWHLALTLGVVLASTACASKSFVTENLDGHAAAVDKRIGAVERSVEENTERTRATAAHLGEVDTTATTALDTATDAAASAQQAGENASVAMRRTAALEAANRQLLFELVLSEDHDQFRFADATLPETAVTKLDDLITRLHDHPSGVNVEIEGHTDETGTTEYNKRLGLKRADSVRRYLHEHHRLPLHKINLISYGEKKPIAPNDTREGRAKNRRVVVRVLATDPMPGATAVTAGDAPLPQLSQPATSHKARD